MGVRVGNIGDGYKQNIHTEPPQKCERRGRAGQGGGGEGDQSMLCDV